MSIHRSLEKSPLDDERVVTHRFRAESSNQTGRMTISLGGHGGVDVGIDVGIDVRARGRGRMLWLRQVSRWVLFPGPLCPSVNFVTGLSWDW